MDNEFWYTASLLFRIENNEINAADHLISMYIFVYIYVNIYNYNERAEKKELVD